MKIIQISNDEYQLYALTETGEVWNYSVGNGWSKIPPLPTMDNESEAKAELAE